MAHEIMAARWLARSASALVGRSIPITPLLPAVRPRLPWSARTMASLSTGRAAQSEYTLPDDTPIHRLQCKVRSQART